MDRVPPHKRDLYETAFRVSDGDYYNVIVESTRENQEAHWINWCTFIVYLGVDPELQDTPFRDQFRCLLRFGGLSQTVYFGGEKQVQFSTVSGSITAVGNMIALAHQISPTKMPHSDNL